MIGSLKLNRETLTPLQHLKNTQAHVHEIEIKGRGNLLFCMISFFKEDKPQPSTDLTFYKRDFVSSQSLPVKHPTINLSEYDFCKIQILTGVMDKEDELVLIYSATSNS